MPNDTTYDILLDKINMLEQELSDIKSQNEVLQRQNKDITDFNKTLLNRSNTSSVRSSEDIDELLKKFIAE